MEMELEKYKAKYYTLSNNTNDLVVTTDLNGNVTSANTAALQKLGYQNKDYNSISFKNINNKEVFSFAKKNKQCGSKNSEPKELMLPTKKGTSIWISMNSQLIQNNGNLFGVQIIGGDITNSKLIQERLETQSSMIEKQKVLQNKQDVKKNQNKFNRIKKVYEKNATDRKLITEDNTVKKIIETLPKIAETGLTVLITGESGTGKELLARALHEVGPRCEKAFIAVNCTSLPNTLLESELFGYRAGAFTDAKKDKPGVFQRADKGCLFLDEIGDISLSMQVKLLRVLEQKKIQVLGDDKDTDIDVCIITATNKNLNEMVRMGKFRRDLYYRINVVPIELPPLRKRRGDIPLLCDHFLSNFAIRYNKKMKAISQEIIDFFKTYQFPGNIRELQNAIEYSCINCNNAIITMEHMPKELQESKNKRKRKYTNETTFETSKQMQNRHIQDALLITEGNKEKAAQLLGIHRTTLFRKIKKMKLDIDKSE